MLDAPSVVGCPLRCSCRRACDAACCLCAQVNHGLSPCLRCCMLLACFVVLAVFALLHAPCVLCRSCRVCVVACSLRALAPSTPHSQEPFDTPGEVADLLSRLLLDTGADARSKQHSCAYELGEVADWSTVVDLSAPVTFDGHGGPDAPHFYKFVRREVRAHEPHVCCHIGPSECWSGRGSTKPRSNLVRRRLASLLPPVALHTTLGQRVNWEKRHSGRLIRATTTANVRFGLGFMLRARRPRST